MLYIVHMDNGSGLWGWVHIVPRKTKALKFAKEYAAGEKRVVYLSPTNEKTYIDFDATKTVVVQAASSYYNGA